ncbi:hypothetical protein EN879_38765, partial [Mesorhizobium sp. M7A.F.Ca.AU.002.02.1.1]
LGLVASVGIGGALIYALQTRDAGRPNEELSMATESGPCFFPQKGPRLSVLRGTPVSARSGEAGRGCTA